MDKKVVFEEIINELKDLKVSRIKLDEDSVIDMDINSITDYGEYFKIKSVGGDITYYINYSNLENISCKENRVWKVYELYD
jgi:hypothetical protein